MKRQTRLGGNICRPYILTLNKGLSNSYHSLSFPIQFTLHSPKGASLSSLLFANLQHFLALLRWMPLLLVLPRKHSQLGEAHTPTTAPGAPGRCPASDFSPRGDTGQHLHGITMFPSHCQSQTFICSYSFFSTVHHISLSSESFLLAYKYAIITVILREKILL